MKLNSSLRHCLLDLLVELDHNLSIVPVETTIEAMLEDITDIVDNMIRLEPAIRSPAPIDWSTDSHSRAGVSTLNATVRLFSMILEYPATFQCRFCTQRFTRAYNLRSHLRIHASENQ